MAERLATVCKGGASGSIKCQQFIGGAIPPGSGGAASKRRMHALAVLVSSSMLYNIATGGMVPPERCTPACKGEGPMQEAIKVSRSLVDRAVPPGYGGAP